MESSKQRFSYIIIYVLILICPLLLGAYVRDFDLWTTFKLYLPYLGVGILALFGNVKIRNLALLFQTYSSISYLMSTLGFSLLSTDKNIFSFYYLLLLLFLPFIWNYIFSNKVKIYQILFTLFLGVFFGYFLIFLNEYTWRGLNHFIETFYGIIPIDFLLILGWILISIFYLIKSRRTKFLIVGFILIYSLFSAFCIRKVILNLILYTTPSGHCKQPISFSLFIDELENEYIEEKNDRAITILYIWNQNDSNEFFEMQKFKILYHKYKNYKFFSFYILPLDCIITEFSENKKIDNYDSFEVPLCSVDKPKEVWEQLNVRARGGLVCILRNDTLIYKNHINEIENYLSETIVK